MKHIIFKDQRGVGHVSLIAIIVAVLAVGGVGWWVYSKNQNKNDASQAVQDVLKNAKCDYEDKDICKFLASWKATDEFTMHSTSESGGQTVTIVLESEGENKSHVTLSGETPYETITIDNAMYTKAGDTWYKKTVDQATVEPGADVNFSDPTADGKISYKKLGTEKCGEFTCFKYEVVDATKPDGTQYLWFDNKNYRLQRMGITGESGKLSATFSYGDVSVSEPSPVKELGPNEYIVPGQSTPTTLPGAGDDFGDELPDDVEYPQ